MCHCKCECNCEIDITKPEEYEHFYRKGSPAKPVLHIVEGVGLAGKRYHIVYKESDGTTCSTTIAEQHADTRLKKKKKWQPTIGKYYLFSDYEECKGTVKGAIGRYVGMTQGPLHCHYKMRDRDYASTVPGTISYKFCWPLPEEFKNNLGE